MAASDFFLYWGAGSPPCFQVMITLEEKKLSGYQNKLLSFSADEHKGEDVLNLNPRGELPTFKHGDIVLNESKGICHYLEKQFKKQGTQLIPDDPTKQALVLQRMYECDNVFNKGIRPVLVYQFYPQLFNIEGKVDKALLAENKKAFAAELEIWEKHLSNEYLAGDEFTMADVFFFPVLVYIIQCGLSMDKRPNLKRYYNKISQRPSVLASWPPHFKEISGKHGMGAV